MSADPVPATSEPITHHIAAALLVAQKALKEVKKDSTNEYHHYDYTSADEMIRCARAALRPGARGRDGRRARGADLRP